MKIIEKINENEIDWNKQQLVISKTNNDIILTTGEHSGEIFSGVIIPSSESKHKPQFDEHWDKRSFVLFYYSKNPMQTVNKIIMSE
jgi:hypothetical protein